MKNLNNIKVIFIDIDKNIALKRIMGRLICKDCNEVYNKYIHKTILLNGFFGETLL